ncbi:Pentatricopeptide repeat-containing protein [Platanthera guangdongensis]|uniref:Pentatricopeptide repeat-containing protein n=1 Tax=Platanthera guangdongensis TaxID=2320717 RepID=A0ABR2MZW4_9ASPA
MPASAALRPRLILHTLFFRSNTNNPSFDLSDDGDSAAADKTKMKDAAKGCKILPPPYYSFSKKPVIEGATPDVVAHTAVIEAYANASGHSNEAIRTFDHMLASSVFPNAYTYAILVKGLARDSKISEARKYRFEMMSKGIWHNAPYSTLQLLHLQPPNSPASFHPPEVSGFDLPQFFIG